MLKFFTRAISLATVAAAVCMTTACDNDGKSVWEEYKDWREFNQNWLEEQSSLRNTDGTPFYTRAVMPTDPQAYVLMHTIGEVNTDNLKPMYTSTTTVNYTLTLANDSVIDQGTDFESQLNSPYLITGWGLAIMQLHVGDSAQFIIPYSLGYGVNGSAKVPPYSNLQFNIRLVDINGYQTRP